MAHNVGNRRFAGDVDKPKNFKKSIDLFVTILYNKTRNYAHVSAKSVY